MSGPGTTLDPVGTLIGVVAVYLHVHGDALPLDITLLVYICFFILYGSKEKMEVLDKISKVEAITQWTRVQ